MISYELCIYFVLGVFEVVVHLDLCLCCGVGVDSSWECQAAVCIFLEAEANIGAPFVYDSSIVACAKPVEAHSALCHLMTLNEYYYLLVCKIYI